MTGRRALMLSAWLFAAAGQTTAGQEAQIRTENYTYLADTPDQHWSYPDQVIWQNEIWTLQNVTYQAEALTERILLNRSGRSKEEAHIPEPELIWDGKSYQYAESSQKTEKEADRSSPIIVQKERMEGENAPETISVSVLDPLTSEIVSAEAKRAGEKKIGIGWKTGALTIPVTCYNYENSSGTYEQNGELVTLNGDSPAFDGYETRILEQNGMDLDEYRITSLEWDGDAYTDSAGILCRNAIAVGDQLVPVYEVSYEGAASFPDLELITDTDEYRRTTGYLITACVSYQREEKKQSDGLTDQITQVMQLGLNVLSVVFLLFLLLRRGRA